MPRLWRLTLSASVVLTACCASAQLYRVQASCPATVSVPIAGDNGTVYLRNDSAPWTPIDFTPAEGRVVIALDPSLMPNGRAMILVNPPPGMDINDAEAPDLLALRVDSAWLEPATGTFLGASKTSPRRIVFIARDADNALACGSVKVSLNGRELPRTRVEPQADGSLWVRAKLPAVDYGSHEVRYSVTDNSPQRNRLEGIVKFARQDLDNFALAAHGTTMTVDSSFSGYESTAPLQDGNTTLPGDTLPGTITWASAETDTPHWVEIDLGRERTIREVTVYWANYTDRINTSRTVEVQVPKGDGWRSIYKSPSNGEEPAQVTTFAFDPVTTQRLRIWQPAGGGGIHRPNLMWLAEVEVR